MAERLSHDRYSMFAALGESDPLILLSAIREAAGYLCAILDAVEVLAGGEVTVNIDTVPRLSLLGQQVVCQLEMKAVELSRVVGGAEATEGADHD